MRVTSTETVEPAKREAILAAALHLFADRGFYGTAVPLVAERAGVGAGTVYRYFESKEALVNALYQRWKRAMGAALLDDFPTGLPTRELFRTMWNRLAKFARENTEAVAFMELHHHAPYLDATSRSLDDVLLGPLRAILTQASAAGVLKPLAPDLIIAMIFGAFVGVAKAVQQGLLPASNDVYDRAEECMWEAVRT